MFLFEPVRGMIDIDLDLVEVFFKLTRVAIKFKQGYDLDRSLKANVIVKGYFDVPILIFSFLNYLRGLQDYDPRATFPFFCSYLD